MRLFDSAEAAYYLKDNIESDPKKEYHQDVVLSRGSRMEIEWMGSEYLYDDEDATRFFPSSMNHERFVRVRYGKYAGNTVDEGDAVELGSGWILGDEIEWSGGHHDSVRIIPIKSNNKSILDLDELFCSLWDDEESPKITAEKEPEEKITLN